MYPHIHTHTCIHTYIHTYIYTYILTHVHTSSIYPPLFRCSTPSLVRHYSFLPLYLPQSNLLFHTIALYSTIYPPCSCHTRLSTPAISSQSSHTSPPCPTSTTPLPSTMRVTPYFVSPLSLPSPFTMNIPHISNLFTGLYEEPRPN